MLIKNEVRKNSDEMIIDLLGAKPEELQFILLSNENTVQDRFKYGEDGKRTDELVAKGVTLHIVGLGAEIDVKIDSPRFSMADKGLGELSYVAPKDLSVAQVSGTYYWKASDLEVVANE